MAGKAFFSPTKCNCLIGILTCVFCKIEIKIEFSTANNAGGCCLKQNKHVRKQSYPERGKEEVMSRCEVHGHFFVKIATEMVHQTPH